MKHPKKKSWKQEGRLVETLQEAGFAAEKIRDQSGRGRRGWTKGGDVSVPLCGVDRAVECKHYKDGFKNVYDALEKADVAVIKNNHKEELVVVRLSTWLEHIRLAESYRAPPISEAAE